MFGQAYLYRKNRLIESLMLTRLFFHLTAAIFFSLFSTAAFSHAGSHENKNCFIAIRNNTIRLSGYQFQGLHPDEAFCRIFPYLGSVIIKIEPVNDELRNQKVALELLKPKSWFNCTSINSTNAMSLKKTPLQNLNEGVNMIQADIQERGVYALNIKLQRDDKKIVSQTFLFLVGIPVTKILVQFSIGVLLLIIFVFAKQNLKLPKINKTLKNPENP